MEPIYLGDIVPSIASYKKIIEKNERSLKKGDFYEETFGEEFNYPDW